MYGLPWALATGVQANLAVGTVLEVLAAHPLLTVTTAVAAALALWGLLCVLRTGKVKGGGLLLTWAALHTAVYGIALDPPGFNWYFSATLFSALWLLYEGAMALPGPARTPAISRSDRLARQLRRRLPPPLAGSR